MDVNHMVGLPLKCYVAPRCSPQDMGIQGCSISGQVKLVKRLQLYMSEHNNTLTSHCSPSSVADAIDHIAERIMAKAAEQATRVVDGEADRTKK